MAIFTYKCRHRTKVTALLLALVCFLHTGAHIRWKMFTKMDYNQCISLKLKMCLICLPTLSMFCIAYKEVNITAGINIYFPRRKSTSTLTYIFYYWDLGSMKFPFRCQHFEDTCQFCMFSYHEDVTTGCKATL